MPLQSKNLLVKVHKNFSIEPMGGKDWVPVLRQGCDFLLDNNIQWQLGSGTLLGVIREPDGLIHHDTDIDIDIIVSPVDVSFKEKLINTLKDFTSNGYTIVRTQHYLGKPMQIAFLHDKTNIVFDLCFFYKEWGSDWLNVYEHGVFIRPPYSSIRATSHTFSGSQYFIPEDVEKYLEGRYGRDWRIPKSGKESGEKDAANYLVVL